jgi:hypothetical protein
MGPFSGKLAYCEVCKAETDRCQYYPKGRSRQHDRCLECDRHDPRVPENLRTTDPRYCSDCDRTRRLAPH